ncbi:hypothetical protein TNCV_3958341 [Trichonephila clavipes]|nr:hypothetical protein TNCV_3958341 [Trichonephila clavipes]
MEPYDSLVLNENNLAIAKARDHALLQGLGLMKPAPNENRGVCNNSNGSSIRLAAFSTAKYVPCALLDTSSTLVLKRSMGKLISGW